MNLKVYVVKKVWFDVPINDLITIPENLRKSWLDNQARKHLNEVTEIEYNIHSDFSATKIPETAPKEKVIL